MSVAGVAHLVERHLAKVEVASSSLVARSKEQIRKYLLFLSLYVFPGTNNCTPTKNENDTGPMLLGDTSTAQLARALSAGATGLMKFKKLT